MKNCLIIGYGWLGKPLAETLLKNGYEVWATSTSEEKCEDMIQLGIRPLKLIKQSGLIEVEKKSNQVFDQVILLWPPFDQVLASLERIFSHISYKKIIFTSSTGVYRSSRLPINEASPIDSSHKVVAMEAFVQHQTNDHVIILRLSGHIGPGRHPLHSILKSQKALTNRDAVVNLIHQQDIIHSIMCAVNDDLPCGIYNVCSPEHPTRADYYGGLARKLANRSLQFESGKDGKIIDGTKITLVSSFKYQHSIQETSDLDFNVDNI